jgi:hypothetical protein
MVKKAVIVEPSGSTESIVAIGADPLPPWKVTSAPSTNPEPLTVIDTSVDPAGRLPGSIPATEMSAGGGAVVSIVQL